MIKDYFYSTNLWTIEDYNFQFKYISDRKKLRRIANEDVNEFDFVNKLTIPMRNIASINHENRDINIKNLDFKVEVKYLRNFKSSTGEASKIVWKYLAKDFDWLSKEIEQGNKGRRAFIIGWFNVYDYLGEVIQLGKHVGQSPKINSSRMMYFPFLDIYGKEPKHSRFNYDLAYKKLKVPSIKELECIFFGGENDKFHIVMYF